MSIFENVNYFMTAIIVAILLYCYSMYFLHILAICYARYYLYGSTPHSSSRTITHQKTDEFSEKYSSIPQSMSTYSSKYPGVTIIKPLCGLDSNLRENLLSLFHMDYPLYEILFCVADSNDPACQVVTTLLENYPAVDARLLQSATPIGVNHKVNNMNQGYTSAKYELILISDSGIYMRPDTLSDMVQVITSDSKIALVHQLPYIATASCNYESPTASNISSSSMSDEHCSSHQCAQSRTDHSSIGVEDQSYHGLLTSHGQLSHVNSIEEQSHKRRQTSLPEVQDTLHFNPSLGKIVQFVYFGCWHARMYLCASVLGVSCTSGMSCLIRKPVLEQAGGLQAFANYLAEDFFISKFMYQHKWRVVLAHQPAWQNSISNSVQQFHARLARWQQLRLMMTPLTTLVEPLTNCVPVVCILTFMWSLLLNSMNENLIWIGFIHVILWIILDYTLLQQVHPRNEPIPMTKWKFLQGWFYRECVTVPSQMKYLFRTRVMWRGHSYRLHCGGQVEELPQSPESQPLQSV